MMDKTTDRSRSDGEPSELSFSVGLESKGERLDSLLGARFSEASRGGIRALLSEGGARVNGRVARKGLRVETGDWIVLSRRPNASDFEPVADESIDLGILYEDADLVVVDKPAGMPSHPLCFEERGTAVQALLARFPEMRGVGYARREAGLVHRLDTDTSGALVVARSREAFEALRESLKMGRWDKRYRALCEGVVEAELIDLPFVARGRTPTARISRQGEGLEALTEILDVRVLGGHSLVEVRVRSGRRHQVRAHLAAIGHPLVGDRLYGGATLEGFDRHFLHASRVVLPPWSGRAGSLEVHSPLSADLEDALAAVGGAR